MEPFNINEWQNLFNAAVFLVTGVLGWFARELWSAVKELQTDLSKLREDLPKTYVDRNDYRSDMAEVKALLNKIFDKLDTKKDKE